MRFKRTRQLNQENNTNEEIQQRFVRKIQCGNEDYNE